MSGGGAGSSWLAGLEFLSPEELVAGGPEFLDSCTLEAVCLAEQSGLGSLAGTKRSSAAIQADDDGSQGEESEDGGRNEEVGKGAKKSKKEAQQAAQMKACKEKARRGKINDRFAELARLIEPGKDPKTDKPSILGDAIKYVQQLSVENHQLKMLNKFLEERVSHYEREKGQALYQQSLAMQGMAGQQGLPGSSSMHAAPGMHMPTMGNPQGQHMLVPHPLGGVGSSSMASTSYMAAQQMHIPQQQMYQQQPQVQQTPQLQQVQPGQQQGQQQQQHAPVMLMQQLPQQQQLRQQQVPMHVPQMSEQQQLLQQQQGSQVQPVQQWGQQQQQQQQMVEPKSEPLQMAQQQQQPMAEPSGTDTMSQPCMPGCSMVYMRPGVYGPVGSGADTGVPVCGPQGGGEMGMVPGMQAVAAHHSQQPHWISAGMVSNGAQDSLLRPPVA